MRMACMRLRGAVKRSGQVGCERNEWFAQTALMANFYDAQPPLGSFLAGESFNKFNLDASVSLV